MVVFTGHRHHTVRTEQLAVAHQRLHDLRQGRSLFSIIYFLLFFC
jgi:hypothetical protein